MGNCCVKEDLRPDQLEDSNSTEKQPRPYGSVQTEMTSTETHMMVDLKSQISNQLMET